MIELLEAGVFLLNIYLRKRFRQWTLRAGAGAERASLWHLLGGEVREAPSEREQPSGYREEECGA